MMLVFVEPIQEVAPVNAPPFPPHQDRTSKRNGLLGATLSKARAILTRMTKVGDKGNGELEGPRMPTIDEAAILEYLHDHAPEIAALIAKEGVEKQQPGASDVHQTTALGNEGKKGR